VRITAAAEHDEQFFGERLNTGVPEEQEVAQSVGVSSQPQIFLQSLAGSMTTRGLAVVR
jgi:hypothetical protein